MGGATWARGGLDRRRVATDGRPVAPRRSIARFALVARIGPATGPLPVRVLLALLVGALVVVSAGPASAQSGGGADEQDAVDPLPAPTSEGSCVLAQAWCRAGVATGDAAGGAGSGASRCEFGVGDVDFVLDVLGSYFPTMASPLEPAAGHAEPEGSESPRPWVMVYCPHQAWGTGSLALTDLFQLGEPPGSVAVRRVAEQAVWVPVPAPSFSPRAADFQVVGLDTWVWLDAPQTVPITRQACVPPSDYACVTITARFVDVFADMADGSPPLVCDGAGTAYDFGVAYDEQRDRPHCGHVYVRTPGAGDTYPVRLTGTWSVSYGCRYDADLDGVREAPCGGGFLDYVARLSDPVPLEVRDLQAVAIRN